MFDTKNSNTFLNNVKLGTQGDLRTHGKFYLQNVVFEGVKYFVNTNEVSMVNGDYKFDYFGHAILKLANTQVVTDIYEGK